MDNILTDPDIVIPSQYENISLGMLLNEMNISHLAGAISSGLLGHTTINMSELVGNITTSLAATNATAAANRQPSHRDPLVIVIPVTICYALIFVAGILGNVITCAVISRNKSMHTATNYYLFNLAVSDLLLLLSGEYRFADISHFSSRSTLIANLRLFFVFIIIVHQNKSKTLA